MKKANLLLILPFLILFYSNTVHAQVPFRVTSGMIYINDGSFRPDPKKYNPIADSLDKKLKLNDKDTTSLFFRSLLYLSFNGLTAKPAPGDKGALENLIIAKDLAEKAIALNMHSFSLKVLRAQLYKELTYRFAGDESWKFNSKQIAERKNQFNNYKELANKYYAELENLDKCNAYDYQKLKVVSNYPL